MALIEDEKWLAMVLGGGPGIGVDQSMKSGGSPPVASANQMINEDRLPTLVGARGANSVLHSLNDRVAELFEHMLKLFNDLWTGMVRVAYQ